MCGEDNERMRVVVKLVVTNFRQKYLQFGFIYYIH